MPIYVYKCFTCNNEYEEIRPYLDRHTLTPCNVCGSVARMVPSRFAMHIVTASEKQNKAKGLVRVEKGMDKQAEDNRKSIRLKRNSEIKKHVENIVMDFDIPGH